MTFTEFMDERYKNREDKGNMFGVGVSDKEFRQFIIDYLLGEDWYVADPLGQTQINEIALRQILEKYSKQYRKECKRQKVKNDKETEKDLEQPSEKNVINAHYWKGFHNGIRTEKFRESKQEPSEEELKQTIDKLNKKIEDLESGFQQMREEIEQNAYPIVHGVNNHDTGMTLSGIFQVLDKLTENKDISNDLEEDEIER